eukprot:m.27885 g.27885  ORF g.27885 m.27885 type:complete len:192 (-) comp8996_c0_seq1:1126-1701(-)
MSCTMTFTSSNSLFFLPKCANSHNWNNSPTNFSNLLCFLHPSQTQKTLPQVHKVGIYLRRVKAADGIDSKQHSNLAIQLFKASVHYTMVKPNQILTQLELLFSRHVASMYFTSISLLNGITRSINRCIPTPCFTAAFALNVSLVFDLGLVPCLVYACVRCVLCGVVCSHHFCLALSLLCVLLLLLSLGHVV